MNYFVFEDTEYKQFLPLTFTKPVYQLKVGIFTFEERWEKALDKFGRVSGCCFNPILSQKEEARNISAGTWVNGRMWPEPELVRLVEGIPAGKCYVNREGEVLAFHPQKDLRVKPQGRGIGQGDCEKMGLSIEVVELVPLGIRKRIDLFEQIPSFLQRDFEVVLRSAPSKELNDPHTAVYGRDNIWIDERAKVQGAILHAEDGPIYIGPNVYIQPGAIVMGGNSIGEGSQVVLGAKLRNNNAIGAFVKVGGEVKNSLISDYCNKGHDGYMGNSVLGKGCNWGANTNVSNMKNTFSEVRQWDYDTRDYMYSGTQFCGTIMGDYSRTGINTMLNTGTVVGVCAHIFGSGFPPKFLPSFSWGGKEGLDTYRLRAAIEGAERHMALKGISLAEEEKRTLAAVYQETKSFRSWEPRIEY